MLLEYYDNKFPIPVNNLKYGNHWLALQCSDVDRPNIEAWTREKLKLQKDMGAQFIKLITSPGGDDGWTPGNRGCMELTFALSWEYDLLPIVRIFRGANGPYWTAEVEKNLKRLLQISGGRPFYVEPANEVDLVAEWGNEMPVNHGEIICRATEKFAYECLNIGIIPVFPSVGYGGPGENYFETFHRVADGSLLDNMAVAVHNYAGAFPIDWIRNDILLNGTPITQEEWDSYNPWCWETGTSNPRTIEYVNRRRLEDAERNKNMSPTDWNYGFWTYEFALNQLDALGHFNTPLILSEFGTRVGEMYDTLPRIDPYLHMIRTWEMIRACIKERRILGTSHWIIANQAWCGNSNNWEDQAWYSHTLDRKVVVLPWPEQIKTPGQLPIVDYLLENPISVEGEEQTMPSQKLGAHIQIGNDNLLQTLRDIKAPVNKTLDLNPIWVRSMKDASPDSLLVARAFVENQGRYKTDPMNLIMEMLDKYAPIVDIVDAIEVPNEEVNNNISAEEKVQWDTFQVMFYNKMKELFGNKVKLVLFNIPTGNFGVEGETTLDEFPLSMALPINDVYIGIHEYGHPVIQSQVGWHALRYRKIMKNYPNHKVIITECGVTNMVIGGPDVGWRTGTNRDDYIDSLVWYGTELMRDAQVIGATVFNLGQSYGWDSFESTSELGAAVKMMPNIEPPPAIVEPIRVYTNGGVIKTYPLEEYLTYVLPAEMIAGSWPMETLKAGAILAREYARWRIKNPRSSSFDIYGDDRDQSCRPDLVHYKSTQAVNETKDIVYSKGMNYVSKCGQEFCPYCLGKNGYDGKVWDRFCQYGAMTLGEQGKTYIEILDFYFDREEETPVEEENNAKDYGVTIVPANVANGDRYWKVISVRHLPETENNRNHHIYIDALDSAGNRKYGAAVSVTDSFGNFVTAIIEKPIDEPGTNVAMYGHETNPPNIRTVRMEGSLKSESVTGIHPAWPDEPVGGGGGNTLFHHSFEIVFKESIYKETIPPVVNETVEDMRDIVWNNLGVNYYPEAALTKFARSQNLGKPEFNEVYTDTHVIQGFSQAWVWCVIGDWGNIHIEEY